MRRRTNGFVSVNPPNHRARTSLAVLALVATTLCAGCSSMCAALRLRDGACRSLADRALAAREQGDDDEALRLFKQASERDPEAIELHREIAALLVARGERVEAVHHLTRVVELDPASSDGWVRLAEALSAERELERAEVAADRALELDPGRADALHVRARVLEESGRPDDALEVYHRILEANGGDVDARLAVARMHLRNGHADRAAPVLRSLCECPLADEEHKAEAWWSLGIAYGRIGRWTDAVRALETGAEERPNTSDDLYRLAYAHCEAGNVQAARVALADLHGRDPHHRAGLELAHALEEPGRVQPVAASVPVPPGW